MPMLPWTEKYRPKKLEELVNQAQALPKVREWMESWLKGRPKKKALLIHGPPGVGKTATVYALASEYGFEVIELNASDERTTEKIKRYVGAAYTMDVFGRRRKLILLDEADNMESSGAGEIARLIDNAQNPIVMTANKYWLVPQAIRNKSLLVEYKALTQRDIMKALWRIVKAENLEVPEEVIKLISQRSNGDLRAAINDLETVAFAPEDAESILAYRDVEKSVFQVLGSIFATDNVKKARMAAWGVDKTPEELMLWIDENIPYVYEKPEDVARAYETLSRADIYFGRANRTGAYGLWKYAMDMITAGIAVSGTKKKGFVRLYPPKTLEMLKNTKDERGLRDELLRRIMKRMHMSKLEAIETLEVLRAVFEHNEDMAAHMAAFLELGDKELEFLAGDRERAMSIKGKAMNIQKQTHRERKMGGLETSIALSERKEEEEEEELTEEELEKADEAIEVEGREEKPKKGGKQATLFDFLGKKK